MDPQKLKKFLVEEWWRSKEKGRVWGASADIMALDGYGAACRYSGLYDLEPEEWHDLDGTGKPEVILRVTELDT